MSLNCVTIFSGLQQYKQNQGEFAEILLQRVQEGC